MAKAPDWLMNAVNSAPNLVEDSPQFRAQEADFQLKNLTKAADEASKAVGEEIRNSEMQTIMSQMQALDTITPTPTPLAGPDQRFFPELGPDDDTPMTPNVPGPSEFAASAAPQPLAGPETDPVVEDPVAEVEQIAQATGLPPQVVASMALLGQDIEKNERLGGVQPAQAPTPSPMPQQQASPGPVQPMMQPPAL